MTALPFHSSELLEQRGIVYSRLRPLFAELPEFALAEYKRRLHYSQVQGEWKCFLSDVYGSEFWSDEMRQAALLAHDELVRGQPYAEAVTMDRVRQVFHGRNHLKPEYLRPPRRQAT